MNHVNASAAYDTIYRRYSAGIMILAHIVDQQFLSNVLQEVSEAQLRLPKCRLHSCLLKIQGGGL